MLDNEEIRWVKSTANELNNLLQVISESGQFLETLHSASAESTKYFDILRNGIERASKVTRMMVERVGGYNAEVSHPPAPAVASPAVKTTSAAPLSTPVSSPPPDVKMANPSGPRELVMIVDDEDYVTMLAQRVLADDGYRVVTARDGFQALELYRKLRDQISLIILDFTMPVMDGSDVFNELLQINPQVSVVLSSGFAEQDRLRTMLAKGMRGFIPKPYTQEKLLTQIRATLDALQAEMTGQHRVI
jgi:CheY-like chemotaxis protein